MFSGSPRGDAYGYRGDGYIIASLDDPYFTGRGFKEGDTIGVLVSFEEKVVAYFHNSKFSGVVTRITDFDNKSFNFGAMLANRGVKVTVLPVSEDKRLVMNAVLAESMDETMYKYCTSSSGAVMFAQ